MRVLERLATELPLKITATLIEDQGYWERCCKARWEICDKSKYGGDWKRMYFEKNLEEIIEHFVPDSTDDTELKDTLNMSTNYVQRLEIKQLLPPVKDAKDDDQSDAGSDTGEVSETDHIDFMPILQALPHLTELHLTYGVRDCGMNFEWILFQFTARDCLLLAKALAACKQLQIFRLHQSKIDDDKVRVLISHMLKHPSLVDLDFSHNMIGDRGARALGKLLNGHSILTRLNVSDNVIRAAGAQAIAHALTKNETLTWLNLRLNRLTDDGGQAICRSLLKNGTLTSLNLGSNDLTEPTASIFSQVVNQNSVIREIDFSCNKLGPVRNFMFFFNLFCLLFSR